MPLRPMTLPDASAGLPPPPDLLPALPSTFAAGSLPPLTRPPKWQWFLHGPLLHQLPGPGAPPPGKMLRPVSWLQDLTPVAGDTRTVPNVQRASQRAKLQQGCATLLLRGLNSICQHLHSALTASCTSARTELSSARSWRPWSSASSRCARASASAARSRRCVAGLPKSCDSIN